MLIAMCKTNECLCLGKKVTLGKRKYLTNLFLAIDKKVLDIAYPVAATPPTPPLPEYISLMITGG